MRIVYIIDDPGGKPSAAYNRVSLFKEGFEKLGISVKVDLCPYFTSQSLFTQLLKSFLLVSYYFRFFLRKGNYMIIYGESFLWRLFSLPRRAKIIVERNEYPSYIITDNCNNGEKTLRLLSYCDGLITCSDHLRNYYSQYLKNGANICVSRIIVDTCKYELNCNRGNFITYCGDWGNHKDGVDILIEAFSIFHETFPHYRLRLIGGSTKDVEDSLHKLALHLGVESFIDYVGRVKHESIPYYLCSSAILALARPNNKQAEGGFPSKVGEYLATGLPVVLTNVGEIYYVLKDGFNCYLAEPDSAILFAEKLIQAASDNNAGIIGHNGKATSKQFDIDKQANCVLDFLRLYEC